MRLPADDWQEATLAVSAEASKARHSSLATLLEPARPADTAPALLAGAAIIHDRERQLPPINARATIRRPSSIPVTGRGKSNRKKLVRRRGTLAHTQTTLVGREQVRLSVEVSGSGGFGGSFQRHQSFKQRGPGLNPRPPGDPTGGGECTGRRDFVSAPAPRETPGSALCARATRSRAR
jgi:hypothetical protein